MHRKPLIIINHTAAKARRLWPIIRTNLEQSKFEYDVYETRSPGDASLRTRTALQGGTSIVAVVGGDGTLSEAAAGFFEFGMGNGGPPFPINPEAALAIIPAGTGDDFARGLTGNRAPLLYWIETLVAHCRQSVERVRIVDVMYGACDNYTSPFICLNASTMGIGGETASRVAGQGSFMRRLSGEARFAAAAVRALSVWRERRVRVSVDDDKSKVIDDQMNLVAVANGLYAGGGMMLSPEARIDDGKLDVITAAGFSRAMVIRELPRIHRGGHVANPRVRVMQGTSVRIETFSPKDGLLIEVDGNVRGKTPVEFQIMPRALRFVTP